MSMKSAVVVLSAMMLVACQAGEPRTPYVRPTIESATVSPEFITAGDSVLIDYTIGSETFFDDGTYTHDLPYASLRTNAGSLVPLRADTWQPGENLPVFEDVADGSQLSDPWIMEQGGHVYALFKAPDSPQVVTIEYWLGGPRPHSSMSHHQMSLEVH